jgi:hypothetical protein
MHTKFNAKRFPVEDSSSRQVWFVDDLARIEEMGPTLRLYFAMVTSEDYGSGSWKKRRSIVVELAIPIGMREQIAREILNFKGVPETEVKVIDDEQEAVVLLH